MSSLSPGARLGPYEVVTLVGAGAMGEVYRARDPRLGRDVAIKVLSSALSDDLNRLNRFEQEARAAAALNHPNLLAVFDIGHTAASPYIVSELLEGKTLREHLKGGPLPLRTAVEYAVEIAHGLAAAHEKGIVHRDLKPENIFITTGGRVKILDFGLAKLTEPEPAVGVGSIALTNAPGTQPGTMLGTVGYMSPEQVRGIPADYRSDIFSFGAILFEMLLGHPAFQRETPADTISAILKEHPDEIFNQDRHVPAPLARIVERCLEKSPAMRFQSTEDLAFALAGALPLEPGKVLPNATMVQNRGRNGALGMWAVAALAAVIAGSIAAVSAVMYLRRPTAVPPVVRLNVQAPNGATLPADPMIRLSPDGTRLAFIAATSDGVRRIWLRPLEMVDSFPLYETPDATFPFWSDDGRSIGFFSDGQLKRVDVTTGATATLCVAPHAAGGTWNSDGVILFSSEGRLQRISAGRGAPAGLEGVNGGREGSTFAYPTFLPDGRHFLYLDTGSGAVGEAAIYAAALDSTDRSLVLPSTVSNAWYGRGYLFFLRNTSVAAQLSATLVAQPFDLNRLTLGGSPSVIAEQVQRTPFGAPSGVFSVSDQAVVYREGLGAHGFPTELTWFDRTGKSLGTIGERADYGDVELSPDDTRAAVSQLDPGTGRDIWVFDLARGIPTRFTADPADESASVWSPDGASIIFSSRRKGHFDLYRKSSSGAGPEEDVLVDNRDKLPLSWSSDGRFLLFSTANLSVVLLHPQLWALPLAPDQMPFPVLNDPNFNEFPGRLSPDGRWVAYASNESGQNEIYVASFPGLNAKWRVSTAGGTWPRWRRDGRELFFLSLDNSKLMVATVNGQQSQFSVGTVNVLFDAQWRVGQRSSYDVTADGQRILGAIVVDQPTPSPITWVVNWQTDLKR